MIWDILMAVAAVAAVAISLVALFLSRRDARRSSLDAERSAASAERSAHAAGEAAAALQRSAAVAERDEAARAVAWDVTRTDLQLWRLENVGNAVAKNLTITVRFGERRDVVMAPPQLRPKESAQITSDLASGLRPWIIVEWQLRPEDGDALQTLEVALPY